MSKFIRSPPPVRPTYGDKICLRCSLTVAEYLNGQLYPSPWGGWGYFHYACIDHVKTATGSHPNSIIIRKS